MEVDEEMRDVLQKQRKLIFDRKENGVVYYTCRFFHLN